MITKNALKNHDKSLYPLSFLEDRRTGKTTIVALRVLTEAIEKHGEWILCEEKDSGALHQGTASKVLSLTLDNMVNDLHLSHIIIRPKKGKWFIRSSHIVGDSESSIYGELT